YVINVDNLLLATEVQKMESQFNFELSKEVEALNVLVLSRPEKTRLRIIEARCPKEHTVKIIKLFSLDEKMCPQHHVAFEKSKNSKTYQVDYYSFFAETKDDKISIFVPTEKLVKKLDIYNRINVKGYDVSIQTKSKSVFSR